MFSCLSPRKKEITGMWTISKFKANSKNGLYYLNSNVLSFGESCKFGTEEGGWSFLKTNDSIKIDFFKSDNTFLQSVSGNYLVEFKKDHKKKLFNIYLSNDSVTIEASKLFYKF